MTYHLILGGGGGYLDSAVRMCWSEQPARVCQGARRGAGICLIYPVTAGGSGMTREIVPKHL